MTIAKTSGTWAIVRRHCEAALAEALDKVSTPGTAIETTEFYRGRIKAVREILALADDPALPPVVSPSYGTD